jgi:hypothetical protein
MSSGLSMSESFVDARLPVAGGEETVGSELEKTGAIGAPIGAGATTDLGDSTAVGGGAVGDLGANRSVGDFGADTSTGARVGSRGDASDLGASTFVVGAGRAICAIATGDLGADRFISDLGDAMLLAGGRVADRNVDPGASSDCDLGDAGTLCSLIKARPVAGLRSIVGPKS